MGPNLIPEEHKEDSCNEIACASGDLCNFLDEEDPFRCRLEVKDSAALVDCSEPPPTTKGFGLLPYLRRKRLHTECYVQPDDFTVESLLSTPYGHGAVPIRPFLKTIASSLTEIGSNIADGSPLENGKEKIEGGREVIREEFSEESLESVANEDGLQPSGMKCSDQPSVSQKNDLDGVVCDEKFRAQIAVQSNLFLIKCKDRKWSIEKTSKIDAFTDILHGRMKRYTERLNEIQAFSMRFPGNVQQFLRAVFDRRPFLEIDRGQHIVDMCLNTYATYPVKKKETIPRKAFASFVDSMREKLKSKREVILPTPIPTEPLNTKDDSIVAENVPLSPDPVKDSTPEKIFPKEIKSSVCAIDSVARPIIAPPPLPSRRRIQNRKEFSIQNVSRDVLLGIMNTMNNFEPLRTPTAFNPEFIDELDDIPPLTGPDDGETLRDGPPIAKRMRHDDDQMTGAALSAPLSPTPSPKVASPLFINTREDKANVLASPFSTPQSCNEQKKRFDDLSKPRKQVSFRDRTILGPHVSPPYGSVLTCLDSVPASNSLDRVEDGRTTPNVAKKVKVDYGDDPYVYMAAKTGSATSSKVNPPSQIKVQLSTSESQLEDPYAAFFPAKRENESSGKRETKNVSPSSDVFRTTFSSLHDRVSCCLATFDIKKSRTRVKWKLIPCSRNRKETIKSLSAGASSRDPRLARHFSREQNNASDSMVEGESEEEVMERTRSVLSKSYRRNPTRCIVDKSVSSIRARIRFRTYCRRMSYPQTNFNLNADVQFLWNKQQERQPQEIDLMRWNLLPKWGSANPNRSLFPFGKTDGMYWPTVQPFDAINLADEQHVICADTRNQLVCLSEMTFASKQLLLCGRDDRFHYKRYMQAIEVDESMWAPGRFRNRIGFQRVFCTQTIEDARRRDEEKQSVEAAWMKRLVQTDATNFNQAEDDDRSFQKAYEPNSAVMADHVDFNLSDVYSRRQEFVRKDGYVLPHVCKGTRGCLQVPRNWFEVPISQYMPTSQRKDYLVQYTNFRNKLTNDCKPNIRSSVSYDDLVQYHLTAIKAIFIHQSGFDHIGVTSQFNEDILQKAKRREAEISAELESDKISIDKLENLCELQEWEESYWTIIWDNLANIYRDAPPISQLKMDQFIIRAFETAANIPQRRAYFHRFWDIVDRMAVNY
ncbi:hypothetical protein RB195_013637 [Necator americanus]